LAKWRQVFSRLFKPAVEREVDEELAFHLEMRMRELIARGHSPEAAREAALRRFGDVAQARAVCRQLGKERDRIMQRRDYLSELRQDVIYGARQLWKNPGFAAIAIFTLALGLGGTTAIFSIVHAVVLQPLPFKDPDRLVMTAEVFRGDASMADVSPGNFIAWQTRNRVFSQMAAAEFAGFNLADPGQVPERISGARVTADYFTLLGVTPQIGRTFTADDAQEGRDGVAILSDRLWRRSLGARADIAGRELRLNGRAHTVIGVMPPSFDFESDGDEVWVPFVVTPALAANFDYHYLGAYGRLKPGVTLAQARDEMKRLGEQLRLEQPNHNVDRTATANPLMETYVSRHRARLFVLLGAVGFVLLIACGNIANLLLARGAMRTSELAIRTALGASRGRVLRQLLTEGLLLAFCGTTLGLAIAAVIIRLFIGLSPERLPRLESAGLNATVVIFAFVLTAVSCVLFALVPAFRASRQSGSESLRLGRSGGLAMHRDRVRTALIVVEVALVVPLLVGAALLVRTAISLQHVDLGFRPSNVISGRVTLPRADYPDAGRMAAAYARIVDDVRTLPGVQSASLVSQAPLGGGGNSNGLIPEGRPLVVASTILSRFRLVTPEYFKTMGIPLKRGRLFGPEDRRDTTRAMIVSESLAAQAWPGQDPIGRRVACCEAAPDGSPLWKTIVGVVQDVRWSGVMAGAASPEFYLPVEQAPEAAWTWLAGTLYITARVQGEPQQIVQAMRQRIAAVDPNVPLFNVQTMDERVAASTAGTRFNTALLMALGLIGMTLAAVGIYGVIAFFVGHRTQEIGVRLALGATPGDVLALVIRQALRPVIAGVVLGVVAALATSRLMASQLFGVTARDPMALAIGVAALIGVGLLAAIVPARRASRIDPTRALNRH